MATKTYLHVPGNVPNSTYVIVFVVGDPNAELPFTMKIRPTPFQENDWQAGDDETLQGPVILNEDGFGIFDLGTSVDDTGRDVEVTYSIDGVTTVKTIPQG